MSIKDPSRMMSTPNGSSPAFRLGAGPTAASEFMTVKEVADIVKLHEKVIRRAYESGELRAYKLRGRIRIRR